ncbi:glutaredoxin [Aspergillus udagawae]|nr:glutaredoxin [Aspergillus udagawae]
MSTLIEITSKADCSSPLATPRPPRSSLSVPTLYRRRFAHEGALACPHSPRSTLPFPPCYLVRNALDRHAAVNANAVPAAPALTPEQPKALITRLTVLVKSAPAMLLKKDTPKLPQSRFNRRLVGILREHSIDHDFFNLLADEDVRQGVKKFAEWPTFPQLWVDGGLVGGLYIYSASKAVD